MLRHVWSFISSVKKHWVSVVAGSGLAAGLGIWRGMGHGVPPFMYWIFAVIGFLVALFLTWRDEHMAKNAALAEVERLRTEGTAARGPTAESWEALYAERKRLTDDLELLESQKDKALLTGFPLELMPPFGGGRERKIQRIKDDLRLINERLKLYNKNPS